MKNHKQLLADFYLALLAIPGDRFEYLKRHVRHCLAEELGENEETIQNIFERMAAEDAKI